jgi:hypothetical protein
MEVAVGRSQMCEQKQILDIIVEINPREMRTRTAARLRCSSLARSEGLVIGNTRNASNWIARRNPASPGTALELPLVRELYLTGVDSGCLAKE